MEMMPKTHCVAGAVALSLVASIAIAQVPLPLRGTIETYFPHVEGSISG
jgi:hypothetical protein